MVGLALAAAPLARPEPAAATTNVITTYAGGGTGGLGDGGPATDAELVFPHGLAVDGAGSLYIADRSDARVRKVDAQGTITTFAGTGVQGSSGDGGPAPAAAVATPADVAFDTAGNAYVASGSKVRKVDAQGTITTFAGTGVQGSSGDGGLATDAELNSPVSVVPDSEGNVYIADKWAHNVRKVNPDGIISTVAGTGQAGGSGDGGPATLAQLSAPGGLALDGAGRLYIADDENERVRRVDEGTITTFAGNGDPGFNGDGGAAVDANLHGPVDVAVIGGAVYVVDKDNNRVREVDPQGIITTVVGNGVPGFGGDGGSATDASLLLPGGIVTTPTGGFVADTWNHRVRRVAPAADQPPQVVEDNATTQEDTAVVVDVLANDSDPDDDLDPTTLAVDTAPQHGNASVLELLNVVLYEPAADYAGEDSFTYSVCDTATAARPAACATAPVSVTVEPMNDAPTAGAVTPVTIIGAPPVTVTLDGSASSDVDGTVVLYAWDFGDGETGAGATVPHTYQDPGVYTATLTVTDDGGLSDDFPVLVTVLAPVAPIADVVAAPTSGPAPLLVSFDGSGSWAQSGLILDYDWDFGDGNQLECGARSGCDVIDHTYAAPGVYTATLTVTDADAGNNLSDSETVLIVVTGEGEPPVAALSAQPQSGDAPLNTVLDASASFDPDGTIVSYAWDYGDGNTETCPETCPTVAHTYTSPGTYAATVTVTDDAAATDTETVEITVTERAGPSASLEATPTAGGAPLDVVFDGTGSFAPGGTIVDYTWDFGDGSVSDPDADVTEPGETPLPAATTDHLYTEPGLYTATLTVKDDLDRTDTASVLVAVVEHTPPSSVITAAPLSGPAPLTVSFDGSSSTAQGTSTVAGYAWEFETGQTATGPTALYAFTTPGIHFPSLTVTDSNNISSTVTVVVVVASPDGSPLAAAGAYPTAGCVPFDVTFDSGQSTDPGGLIVSQTWDFGDGSPQAGGASVTHRYDYPGTWVATLTVADNDNLTSTATKTIDARECDEPPTVSFEEASHGTIWPGNTGGGGTSELKVAGADDHAVTSFEWDLNGDQVVDAVTPPLNTTDPDPVVISGYTVDPVALGLTPPQQVEANVRAVDDAGQKSSWGFGPTVTVLDPNCTGDADGDGSPCSEDPNDNNPNDHVDPSSGESFPLRALWDHPEFNGLFDQSILPQSVSALTGWGGQWAYNAPMDIQKKHLFPNTPWEKDYYTGPWVFGAFESGVVGALFQLIFKGELDGPIFLHLFSEEGAVSCTEKGKIIDWKWWSICDEAHLKGIGLVLGPLVTPVNGWKWGLSFQDFEVSFDDDEATLEQRDEVHMQTSHHPGWSQGWPGTVQTLDWEGKTGYSSKSEVYVRPIVRFPNEEDPPVEYWKP